jgi:hypothetical protein
MHQADNPNLRHKRKFNVTINKAIALKIGDAVAKLVLKLLNK